MINISIVNDHRIKSHAGEPYVVKDQKKVIDEQNTIVVSEKSLFQKIKKYLSNKN